MSRILLVDDHELMRHGARQVLQAALPGAEVGEARNSAEANEALAARPWDLLVLDLNMPGRSGLELLADLRGRFPAMKVLILSTFPEEELALRCIQLGADGYLTKASAAGELVAAVTRLLAGGRWVSAVLAELLAGELGGEREPAPHESLSPRELQVLRLVASGRSHKEIGAELHLSEKTVATYRSRLGEKLGLSRLADVTRYAVKHRLID